MDGFDWQNRKELECELAYWKGKAEGLAERVNFLTTLALRAVHEGWTLAQLEAELWREGH